MAKSGHVDTFARDNLPPREQWPEFRFDLPELQYPERLNCVTELVDRWVAAGEGARPCLISPSETLTYAQLHERVNRIANVLTRDLGLVPGNRVLLRGPNNPMMVAAYFAVIKAGGVVVATMPLLRAKELVLSARQGQDRAGALRRPARRRDGEGQGAVARDLKRSSIGARQRRTRGADGASPATSISPPATPRATTSA